MAANYASAVESMLPVSPFERIRALLAAAQAGHRNHGGGHQLPPPLFDHEHRTRTVNPPGHHGELMRAAGGGHHGEVFGAVHGAVPPNPIEEILAAFHGLGGVHTSPPVMPGDEVQSPPLVNGPIHSFGAGGSTTYMPPPRMPGVNIAELLRGPNLRYLPPKPPSLASAAAGGHPQVAL